MAATKIWTPCAFLQRVNELVYATFPGALMIAEESTSWPGVSQPLRRRPRLRLQVEHGLDERHLALHEQGSGLSPLAPQRLTFGLLYAFSENFILPISHDEVVHGKGSLIGKMPGDDWQKFANARAYLAFMWAHPGKKLLFMGQEFGQTREWTETRSLDWHLLHYAPHQGLSRSSAT